MEARGAALSGCWCRQMTHFLFNKARHAGCLERDLDSAPIECIPLAIHDLPPCLLHTASATRRCSGMVGMVRWWQSRA